jgi:NAD binding domain of 6-phosphogluconate dehydrogenase/X-Pro dipeptidyl-peptidase (S15 family)
MRDGVRIAVDVVVPVGGLSNQRFPTGLEMTRYWRGGQGDPVNDEERTFTTNGFAIVIGCSHNARQAEGVMRAGDLHLSDEEVMGIENSFVKTAAWSEWLRALTKNNGGVMKYLTKEQLKLSFIGMGNMGSRIARRLLDHGYQMSVYDRNLAKAETIASQGATYGGFFPCGRYNGEFYLSFLNIKNSVGGIALSENALLLGVRRYRPAVIDGRKKSLRIKFNFLGRYFFLMISTPSLRTKTLKRWFHSWMTYVNRE